VVSAFWPLPALRLRTAELVLRPVTEADLEQVAATLSPDVGSDPTLPAFPGLPPDLARGTALHQGYWRSLGSWSVASWQLPFAVLAEGEIVGMQTLEGTDFPLLRTVDSSSHLAPDVRGRGWGKQMRRAVLSLAFGPLDAQAAVTSAWHHNQASLGVSRAVGYQPNGEHRHRTDDGRGVDTMVHLRLARGDWDASGQAAGVDISGFDDCRPFFGI
jgi:RimJ/RimL family protein N-acetyltransferase